MLGSAVNPLSPVLFLGGEFSEIGFLSVALVGLELAIQIIELPASASQVLGTKACVVEIHSTSSFWSYECGYFFLHAYLCTICMPSS